MISIKSLNKWANAHTYYPLDLLRIVLGVFFFLKGIQFVAQTHMVTELIGPLKGYGGVMLLVHYIAPAHLVGGLLIAFGLLTRWALIAQVPILLGAILVNFLGPFNLVNLLIAVIVLALTAFFIYYGSGKHSLDYYFKMQV